MKDYLISILSKYLSDRNFFFEKKSLRFCRDEKERICSIRINFIHNKYVYIYYEIRFNLIENLIDDFYRRKSVPLSPTIFIDTGSLLVEPHLYKFPIEARFAVEESAVKVMELIERFAFPYFNQYRNVNDLNRLLNEVPFKPMKIRNDEYHNEVLSGFFRGLLAAKLTTADMGALSRKHVEYITQNKFDAENIQHYMAFAQWANELQIR